MVHTNAALALGGKHRTQSNGLAARRRKPRREKTPRREALRTVGVQQSCFERLYVLYDVAHLFVFLGAGDGDRTRGIKLGKLAFHH